MNDNEKYFSSLTVVSVTSGYFITDDPDGIGAIYKAVDWMAKTSAFTHQIPRLARECTTYIHEQHPQIKWIDRKVKELCGKGLVAESIKLVLDELGTGITIKRPEVFAFPEINPLAELAQMVGKAKNGPDN